MTEQTKELFEQLWTDYLEGELDADGWQQLERLLAADPELLRRAADLYEEHRLVGLTLQPYDGSAFVTETCALIRKDRDRFVDAVTAALPAGTGSSPAAQPLWARWASYAAVASVTLLASLLFQWWGDHFAGASSGRVVEKVRYQPVQYAASLVRDQQCRWGSAPETAPAEGDQLIPGQLRLEGGRAVLRFDGGALALLSGPAEFQLESAGAATLRSGDVTVRTPEEAAGFILRTPAVDVIDLGAEFSVHVEPDGATELHVARGELEWHGVGSPRRIGHVLTAGSALRFNSADASARSIPYAPERFDDLLDKTQRRSTSDGLIAYEDFRYDFDKSMTRDQQAGGGFGWASPWYCAWPASPHPLFFAPSSRLATPLRFQAAGSGAMVLPTAEGDRTYREASKRKLAAPLRLDRDGVYYVSFLVRRAPETTTSENQAFRLVFTAPRDLDSRIGFGALSDGRPVVLGAGGNSVAPEQLTSGRSYLWVGKIVCGKDRPDQMFLKVYDQSDIIDTAEPLQWTVLGRTMDHDKPIDQVHIYNGPGRAYQVDEVRLGDSWEAVTPLSGEVL